MRVDEEDSEAERLAGGRGDRRLAVAVALVAAVLALPFLTGISMLDEGAVVHIADRIASGEVLYRDVATGAAPGCYYLQALLFLAFGRSLLVGRVFMIALFALASASVFLIARRDASRTVALAAVAAFVALSVHYWRFPGYSPEAIFLVLLTLAAARSFIDSRRPRWLVATGLGIGAGILFKQNYGAFAALGVATGFAAAAPDLRRAARDVAMTAIVAAAPIAAVAALFASAGAWTDFWASTVGVPLRAPQTVFARPWPSLFGEPEPRLLRDAVYDLPFEELALDAQGWLLTHRRLAVALVRLVDYLPLAFFFVAGMVWRLDRARLRRASSHDPADAKRSAAGALYLGASVFLFLGVFPRVDAHHLFMALAPCFLLGAWALGPSPRPWLRRGAVLLSGALLALSGLSQAAVVYAAHPEEIRDAFLPLPRARVWVERWRAAQIREQIGQVRERVPEGEPIFAAPSSPMYYFLADRPNPTRYPLILPGALDEEEVVRTLSASRVRYALVSDIAFEHFPFQYVAPIVWDYLDHHFVPAAGAGWDVAPLAPYLLERGRPDEDPDGDPGHEIVEPPLSPPPVFQTVSYDDWRDEDPFRVEWQSTYLEPSLVIQAPGSWRKVLVSWEVPVGPGYRFELACALAPWAWAGWVEGQGALVEVWVSASPAAAPPRRVFLKWLNPRDVSADRRWQGADVDLASVVDAPKAVVTLVVGPAPTFVEADAMVAFRNLRLVTGASPSAVGSQALQPRNVRLDESAARRMLAFQEEDLAIFREAARRYPDLAKAHVALAEVAASLGRHDVALSAAEAAVHVDPEPAPPWMRLGQELRHAGRLDEAIASMEAALARDPTNANYHAALADARLSAPDDLAAARADALLALRLDPENVWAWTLLSTAERRLGNDEAALRAAERSVALAPDAAWPHLTLAAARLALERPEEALEALERAARLPLDAGARAELARELLLCGRTARAREESLAATEEDPGALGAWIVLGHTEIALEHWEAAADAWQVVVRLDPESSSAFVQLARALGNASRAEEARRVLASAEELAGDDPSRIREVAIVLDELGSPSEAASVWRRVLALATEGPVKDEARRRLGIPSS